MKKEIETYETYDYDELSDAAKEKALEELAYTNVEHDWYEDDHYPTYEIMRKCGIATNGSPYFDLDRDNYLYFDTHGHGSKGGSRIYVESQPKLVSALLKSKVISKEIAEAIDEGDLTVSIATNHYGGGSGKNVCNVESNSDRGYDLMKDVDEDAITDWLSDMLDDLRRELRDDYEYLTGREAIEETIRANDIRFYADGSRKITRYA